MGKKWVGYVKYSVLGVGVIGVAVGLPFAVINSKSYDLFAEIIVSDNTSVLADSSFSETTYNGFQKFVNTKEGKEVLPTASSIPQSSGVWRRPGDTTFSRETTFRGLFASGKDMLIAPGFNHETAIRNVATDPNFSDKGFLLLDSAVENVTNVSSFVFRADQSGFLTGIAACIFLNDNKEIFLKNNSDNALKVGAFVGLAFPSTTDFLAGFQAGVFAWNKVAKTTSAQEVEWISLGKKLDDYASGGFGVGGGVEKADLLLSKGADVIMAIAGPQTADVVGQIVSKKVTAVVAGVDSSQELQTINKPLPLLGGKPIKNGFKPTTGEYSGQDMVIQFSAVKHLDVATNSVLDAIFSTTDPNNEEAIKKQTTNGKLVGGFGFKNTGTIENGTVGTSLAGVKQLASHSSFSSWVNTDNTIKWDSVKADDTFLAMTNNGKFYCANTVDGVGTLKDSNGAIAIDAFFPLTNGIATALDIVNNDKRPKLNGSKWVIVR
ncbi:MAG: BMP family ABC transporter substrate-binding protein [Malacoplasma sp.]